jgi:hypothetical protein
MSAREARMANGIMTHFASFVTTTNVIRGFGSSTFFLTFKKAHAALKRRGDPLILAAK